MLRAAICDDEKILMEIEEITGRFFRLNCIDSKITTYQSSENLQYDLQDGIVYDPVSYTHLEIPVGEIVLPDHLKPKTK